MYKQCWLMVVRRAWEVNRKLSFYILCKWNLLHVDKQVPLFNENQSQNKTQKLYDWQYCFSTVLLIFKWNFNSPRFANFNIQREEALWEETGHSRECEKHCVAAVREEWQKRERNRRSCPWKGVYAGAGFVGTTFLLH